LIYALPLLVSVAYLDMRSTYGIGITLENKRTQASLNGNYIQIMLFHNSKACFTKLLSAVAKLPLRGKLSVVIQAPYRI